jgi:phosphopantothenoylcysteine decarboxylase
MRLVIGVTGSVAAIKLLDLIRSINARKTGAEVRVILTRNALPFIRDLDEIKSIVDEVYDDDSDWTNWKEKGDAILHIELRKWCNVLLICPLSANSLAKIANGICDNLLTSLIRAWDVDKRMIVCPAMNSFMWSNPLTAKHLEEVVQIYKCEIVEPKQLHKLACGDVGPGALADIEKIVNQVFRSR